MKQYKINRSKVENLPSDETVEKHKNLKGLQVKYTDVVKRSKLPLYKNKKMFLFLLLVGLVAYLIATEWGDEEEEPEEENKIESTE
ncbi:MAG: hypothetical protein JKY54_15495 [Flavobacteriales bacterium]|nr:hypothetical protein [Flavobacteriales bacterium]